VVLVPGYLTTATTMAPLGWYLRRLGHRVVPWGFGLNRGTPEDDLPRMVTRIQALTQAYPEPVVLVGWSLGGVIARETAREAPELVAGVVTYGTPIVGGPTFTVAGDRWPEEECARISALVEERDANDPLRTPVTVIFSRNDGVVDWPAALDRTSLDVRHVEVASSHVGLGFDPDVWEIVADAAATYSETAA
jgi:pimeloyl-ACP methyl ester carboxylesterase